MLNAIERLASMYELECTRIRQDLKLAEDQLRDYHARLGTPFLHDAYLSALTVLRDQLKARLSTIGQHADDEPTSIELAEQIKTLKAANTVEGTVERASRRELSAEEPVTARIRRRLAASLATNGDALGT